MKVRNLPYPFLRGQPLNNPSDETNSGIQPIVVKSPVLAKRVNRFGTWLEKPRVKSWQLGIVTASEPIHGMRTPEFV